MDFAILSQFSLFSNFSRDDLTILASYLEEESFLKGNEIYYPGKVRDKLRLIVHGYIEVVADSLYSFEEPKAIYGPGQLMGESALLQGGALHKARAHAMSDGSLYILSRSQFLKMMSENGRISCQLQSNIGAFTFEKISRGSLRDSVLYAGYSSGKKRLEHDLLGEREIPADAYFGVQTLRALENFNITGIPLSSFPTFIKALAQIKKAAARAGIIAK
jgi:aspartate ammonia-lyase